jgi:hypothetical protein
VCADLDHDSECDSRVGDKGEFECNCGCRKFSHALIALSRPSSPREGGKP